MMQKLPEIGPRLRFARGRPQQKCQSLSGLWCIAIEDEVCEQGLETVRVDSCERTPGKANPHGAKKVDPHGYRLQ
jgi:hypothetical protein